MKKGKSKQNLRIDWHKRELIRNLEAIFKEGSKHYHLMDEKEVCDKIMTLPPSKAPKNKTEFFMVMEANHRKNELWAKENPEPATPVEDGECTTELTSEAKEQEELLTNSICLTSADKIMRCNIELDGLHSSQIILTSGKNLSEEDGN